TNRDCGRKMVGRGNPGLSTPATPRHPASCGQPLPVLPAEFSARRVPSREREQPERPEGLSVRRKAGPAGAPAGHGFHRTSRRAATGRISGKIRSCVAIAVARTALRFGALDPAAETFARTRLPLPRLSLVRPLRTRCARRRRRAVRVVLLLPAIRLRRVRPSG